MKKKGYLASDSIGQSGIERTYDTLSARQGRDGAADRRLARAAEGRRDAGPIVDARRDAPPDDRHQPAARSRAGAHATASDSPTRAPRASTRTAPRSSRSTRATATMLAMASNPTYKPSLFVGPQGHEEARAAAEPDGREERQLSGAQPRDPGRLPAGVDVQARDALAAMQEHLLTPVHAAALHADLHRVRQTFHNWTPDIDQWIDLRTALANRATRTSTSSATTSIACRRTAAIRLQGWANRFGLGETTGIDIGGEIAGLDPDAGVALQARSAARRARDTSTGSGSRATRSSSRSGRATCS